MRLLDDLVGAEALERVIEHVEHDIAHALRVPITIDRTGWLRGEIDLLYERSVSGLRPVLVKIGRQARPEDVRAIGDVYAHFARYNLALARLRGLKLKHVDSDINNRQRDYMGHGTVRFRTLLRESEYLDALLERHAPTTALSPTATDDRRAKEPPRCP